MGYLGKQSVTGRVRTQICQQRLAALWLAMFVLTLLEILATAASYGSQTDTVWKWYFPSVLPTVTLVVGAIAGSARRPISSGTVRRFAYRTALLLSVVYLLTVAGIPVSHSDAADRLAAMRASPSYLVPFQSVVAVALGAFFGSRRRQSTVGRPTGD
jgi:DMSO reductase anchor subunit